MTRRRWIADEVHGNTAALTGEHAFHLSRVLRAQAGQEFDIATGNAVRLGKITSISDDRVEFALGAELAAKPLPRLTLVLAIFKFDRMEWAIEKCTEIGATRIVPLTARRTDSHLAAAAGKRRERWQRIAREASEQARRAAPPEISAPIKFADLGTAQMSPVAQAGVDTTATRIVLAESDGEARLREILGARAGDARQVILATGPEGGWADEEMSWFRQAGWAAASLGVTILRAETAAIVATALALDALE
ncbi:MAG: RsmE family RNA methyltransferase [Terriglobales bacterium]